MNNENNKMKEEKDKKLKVSDVIEKLDMLQFKAFDIEEDGTKTEWVYGKYIEFDDVKSLVEELKNSDSN